MQPPRDEMSPDADEAARHERMLALLLARGLTSVAIQRLAEPGTDGLTIGERIARLAERRGERNGT